MTALLATGCREQVCMQEKDNNVLKDLQARLDAGEITGVSIDSRTVRNGELFIAIRGDRFDGHDFMVGALERGACCALAEEAAVRTRPALLADRRNVHVVEDTLAALQELALLHRQRHPAPLAAVTGSNGKTTTKEMLAAILARKGQVLKNEGNLNNHIGVPLTLLRLRPEHRAAVIELGMSGFGEIALLARLSRPDAGVITNIGPAHLEFLGSTDGVAKAKGELLETMRPDGTAVLNSDDRYFETLRKRYAGRVISFGTAAFADVRATDIRQTARFTDLVLRFGGRAADVRLAAPGRHNVSNALAAAATAMALGMSIDDAKAGLEAFRPVSMRSEVRDVRGITVIADCYNANPASMAAAVVMLASLRREGAQTIAVLGDMLELGSGSPDAHREIGRSAAAAGIDLVIVLGEQRRQVAEGALSGGMEAGRVLLADSAAAAAAILRERARPGDTVLLKGSRGMKMEKVLEEF